MNIPYNIKYIIYLKVKPPLEKHLNRKNDNQKNYY